MEKCEVDCDIDADSDAEHEEPPIEGDSCDVQKLVALPILCSDPKSVESDEDEVEVPEDELEPRQRNKHDYYSKDWGIRKELPPIKTRHGGESNEHSPSHSNLSPPSPKRLRHGSQVRDDQLDRLWGA